MWWDEHVASSSPNLLCPSNPPLPLPNLQVLGNMKGVIAAAISVALFKNKVTVKGLIGYAITMAGVFLYSASKRRAQAAEVAKNVLADSEEKAPLIKTCDLKDVKGGSSCIPVISVECVSGGAVLPTSTQQLQSHRSGRSSGGGVGSGYGGGPAVVVVNMGHA